MGGTGEGDRAATRPPPPGCTSRPGVDAGCCPDPSDVLEGREGEGGGVCRGGEGGLAGTPLLLESPYGPRRRWAENC